jgi:hypothetical protein
MIQDIVIGKPIVTPEEMGLENPIFTEERFLPKILVDLKIFRSNSEVRKNRPDLMIELTKMDFLQLKIGKHRLWILVGE